jgi:hypothetical protein
MISDLGKPVTFFSIEEAHPGQWSITGLCRRALLFLINLLTRTNSPEGVASDGKSFH